MPVDALLKTVLLPLALMLIMFGMGLTLEPADFLRVVRKPKAKLVGLFCQLVLLPLTALALVLAFGLQGELAVGMLLIAACPGGATSNIISHLSRGDTALSVSLTAVSSLETVFTIPLVVGTALTHFMATEAQVPFRFVETVMQLSLVVLLPVGIGMTVRTKAPRFAATARKPFTVISVVFLVLIILLAVLKEDRLADHFQQVGLPVLLLNLLTMATGFGVAALARLPRPQQVTVSIESGIQNGTLALGIALGLLDSPAISIPAVVYSLLMFVTGGAVIAVRSRG